MQSESIFPPPAGNPIQRIPITRDQLFGQSLTNSFPNRNPSDVHWLSVKNPRIETEPLLLLLL
jgi:hypothetical protein